MKSAIFAPVLYFQKTLMDSIIILTGGGPAPGMNTVVGTLTKAFLNGGYRVFGLHGGYSGIFSENPRLEEMTFFMADAIFNRGGSFLKMSRFKPTDEDFEKNFNLDLFKKNRIKLLVTVGGDDTATTANRIAKFLESKQYPIRNIHVPKTIDNDLPLPGNAPTFGFNSAKNEGAHLARTAYEDARTSENWFIVSAMGRSAGHLALGIGEATHCPMTIIPEMFNKTKISIDKIIRLAISSIIKRMILDIHYGSVVVAEGVFHDLKDDEISSTGVHMTFDAYGHPELGKFSKAVLFNDILEKYLKEIKLSIKTRPLEIGYDVRCQDPIAYDLTYCTELAMGAYELFCKGETGCMVYVDSDGKATPLYLKDLQNDEGQIEPRRVNIDGGIAQNYYNNICHYITPADYEAARKYVADPENYDFKKILNW